MKTLAITAFNDELRIKYAHEFLDTYQGVDLKIYSETPQETRTCHLYWHEEFLKRNRHRPRQSWKYDAVRFAYKSYAIAQACHEWGTEYDRLLWLDADCVFLEEITEAWITDELYREHTAMTYFGRPQYHPETGVMLFNLNMNLAWQLIAELKQRYDTDQVYLEQEWHDAWIWQQIIKEHDPKLFYNRSEHLKGKVPGGHVINACIGNRIDHRKGSRKQLKRSPEGPSNEDL